MNNYPHPVIAREGWPLLGASIVVALAASFVAGAWSLLFWLGALGVLRSFRDPARTVPQQPNAVLSPADGRVVVVEKARDPYADREALRIGVFTGFFSIHLNRAPVDGRIQRLQYFPGGADGASSDAERNAMVIAADNGHIVTCVQVAGRLVRRIFCFAKTGDTLKRGQRFGRIRLGARVDVYLPLLAMPKVSVGDKVSATETILAVL